MCCQGYPGFQKQEDPLSMHVCECVLGQQFVESKIKQRDFLFVTLIKRGEGKRETWPAFMSNEMKH